jgi:hypothetical protein
MDMLKHKLEDAINILVNTGQGFSISMRDVEMPDKGYMVGGFGFEMRIDKHRMSVFRISRLAYFLRSISTTREQFIGGWMDDQGNVCIDISECVTDILDAKTKGRANRQDAIYDIANDTDINLK